LPNGSWNDDPYSTALALRALHIAASDDPPVITGTVTGKVVDSSTGQPLRSVVVVVQNNPDISAVTDTTGDFTLTAVPEGSRIIEISLPGYVTTMTTLDIAVGSINNLGTIPLSLISTAGIIKGVVTDAGTAQPLEGVMITVNGSFNSATVTDANGGFIFTDVTPGSVTVMADRVGYYTVSGTGAVKAGVTLLFNPQMITTPPASTTGNLTGTVIDGATNLPVQGAAITLTSGLSTITDMQGGFMIADITPNEYQVTISADGYIGQLYQVMISAGITADLQTVYLTPVLQSSAVTGTVKDIQTGLPLADADVIITGTGIAVKTDAIGSYTLSRISLFEFDVTAGARGYESLQYHASSSGYSQFEVNFNLGPIQLSDLRVIAITSDPAIPTQGETVDIKATIYNEGYSSAANVLVRVFEGDPDSGGVQIGADRTIPSIAPGSAAEVSVNFDTTSKPGRREIYVQTDPLNSIKELNDTNNTANGTLAVLMPPDFVMSGNEITYSPLNPSVDMPLSINAIIRNIGEKEEKNVLLSLYKGDPVSDGVLIADYTVPALSGNGSDSAIFTINNPEAGTNGFYIVADPDGIITEMNESNNTEKITIDVSDSVDADLSIYPPDIKLFLPADAEPGEVFAVRSLVKNTGSSDIRTYLAFYNGDPASDGTLMGTTSITVPAFGTNTTTENLPLPGGNAVIYIVVDPDNLVEEAVETNNTAFVEIGDINLPDFVITEHQIRFSPSSPTPNSQVTIEADVYNYGGAGGNTWVQLYEGDPDSGGVLKGSFQLINYVDPHDFMTATITITNLVPGNHEFHVISDPNDLTAEVNETNNRAIVNINVVTDPAIDLSIKDKDIAFSPEYPLDGEIMSIKADIYNAGSESVSAWVLYYNGDPLSGGTRIFKGWYTFNQQGSTQISSPNFYMTSGVPEIFVVIDEDDQLVELDESNNRASRVIATYKDDLWVATPDISLNPVIPGQCDIISIDVTVRLRPDIALGNTEII
jgi:subtilase family serine protease